LDFTGAKDNEWQWHQLGQMQICTSPQTDNHASTPPLSFLQARCPSCHPTNSIKALKGTQQEQRTGIFTQNSICTQTKLAMFYTKIKQFAKFEKIYMVKLSKKY